MNIRTLHPKDQRHLNKVIAGLVSLIDACPQRSIDARTIALLNRLERRVYKTGDTTDDRRFHELALNVILYAYSVMAEPEDSSHGERLRWLARWRRELAT